MKNTYTSKNVHLISTQKFGVPANPFVPMLLQYPFLGCTILTVHGTTIRICVLCPWLTNKLLSQVRHTWNMPVSYSRYFVFQQKWRTSLSSPSSWPDNTKINMLTGSSQACETAFFFSASLCLAKAKLGFQMGHRVFWMSRQAFLQVPQHRDLNCASWQSFSCFTFSQYRVVSLQSTASIKRKQNKSHRVICILYEKTFHSFTIISETYEIFGHLVPICIFQNFVQK